MLEEYFDLIIPKISCLKGKTTNLHLLVKEEPVASTHFNNSSLACFLVFTLIHSVGYLLPGCSINVCYGTDRCVWSPRHYCSEHKQIHSCCKGVADRFMKGGRAWEEVRDHQQDETLSLIGAIWNSCLNYLEAYVGN